VTARIVVLGVGNLLMGDEGLGIRGVEALEKDGLPRGVRCIDGGTSTHELLEDLENLDALIILDAVASGQPPGTLVRLEDDAIPSAFSNKMSPHQHGINDLLATLKLLGREPRHVVLIGVEPAVMKLSLQLSPLVGRVLPTMVALVAKEVAALSAEAA
jgi:hydrogenase maturation protease